MKGILEVQLVLFSSFRTQLPPVEVMPTPYHTLSWLGPACASRTHKNTFSRLGVDEQPAAQVIYKREQLVLHCLLSCALLLAVIEV